MLSPSARLLLTVTLFGPASQSYSVVIAGNAAVLGSDVATDGGVGDGTIGGIVGISHRAIVEQIAIWY